jgi:hypothetical protein
MALLLSPLALGCATYSDRLAESRQAVISGDFEGGVKQLEKVIKVDDPKKLPDDWGSDVALAVLERATLQQALRDWKLSARDFGAADKELEMLDMSAGGASEIGKYIYSDSATKYRTSPVEKLSLNGFNMMNYLARGDTSGARVEAKRFNVMRTYLQSQDPNTSHGAFASYLAGFTHEQLGEYTSAIRYYDEALQGHNFASLKEPVARLAKLTPYRGKRLKAFMAENPVKRTGPAEGADLLVVVSIGRVRHKFPERIPIGLAIGLAGTFISGNPAVLGHTAAKVVIFPGLAPPDSVYRSASLQVDGRPAPLERATDLGAAIEREYTAAKPKIIGAAISRMIVRAVAAEATRQGVRAGGSGASEVAAFFAALAVEGTLAAMDKPDTRSWSYLPDQVLVYRQRVEPGPHTVEVVLGNETSTRIVREVDVPPRGFAAVIVTAPR